MRHGGQAVSPKWRVRRAMFAEAWAVARSELVASGLIALLVAGMCVAVVLTAGRSEGVQRQVLASIDAVGTRSIVVRAEPEAGVDSQVITRLAAVEGIEWAGAFGPASDSRNAAFEGGTPVATRALYTLDSSVLEIPSELPIRGPLAFATPRALDVLGLPDRIGTVTTTRLGDLAVVGHVKLPDYLGFLEPHLFVPAESGAVGPVALVVVVTTTPALVGAVTDVLSEAIAASDRTAVAITTSEAYATLRSLIDGELGGFSRALLAATCGVLAVLVAALGYGLVMIQRKNFGRRRALGATRGLIAGLVVLRAVIAGLAGAALGGATAWAALALGEDPTPDPSFLVAVAVLSVLTAGAGALVPALVASRRDPLMELRVP